MTAKLRPSGAGWYLTTADDRTLYTFSTDKDRPGESSCYDRCESNWMPFPAGAEPPPSADWTVIERKTKEKQWAYRGSPLYTFKRDLPGTLLGDRHDKAWHVVFTPVETPPDIAIKTVALGRILTTHSGKMIYQNIEGASACAKPCRDWAPVKAPWTAKARGEWSVVKSDSGVTQWAYRGAPLFVRASDGVIPDASLADWQPVVLEAAPGVPAWIKVQKSDLGPLLADDQHRTLYRFFPGDIDRLKRIICDDACIASNWEPVPAKPEDVPIGNWRPAPGPDGQLQWTYKAGPVFRFRHDKRPGDAFGDKFAGMESPWSPILQASLILSEP